MIRIEDALLEVLNEEARADDIIKSAQNYALDLKTKLEIKLDDSAKAIEQKAKSDAKQLIEDAKIVANQKADLIIAEGIKKSEQLRVQAQKNIPEVSDYIIHKLKVSYGNR